MDKQAEIQRKKELVINEANRLSEKFGVILNPIKFEHLPEKAIGVFSRKDVTITINLLQIEKGLSDKDLIEVVRHEFAHYLDWVYNQSMSHGKSWRIWATRVGCNPRATTRVEYDWHTETVKKEKWIIATVDGKILKVYERKPRKFTPETIGNYNYQCKRLKLYKDMV